MGKALYRKYRSKSLDEIVGQEHITDTLKRAIKTGRVSHAYLFTGPRGVGKTSIARILAHELNGVPYADASAHLDIIEIDAATSGGVDEVRDLRDKVYLAPTGGKYKIYIIDEVHMMTTAAFNALLKTLEEPPAHVVFILATTEAHKLPATIISRTQRFTFRPIPAAKVVEHLRHIATEEKIDITDDALELIATHGGGSFRDSIGILDQASSLHAHVDRARLETLLGIPPSAASDDILSALSNSDAAQLITTLTELRSNGYQAAAIAKQLGDTLRKGLIEQTLPLTSAQTLHILSRLIDVPASANPDQLLELILLEIVLGSTAPSPTPTKSPAKASPTDHQSHTTPRPDTASPNSPQPKAAMLSAEPANISTPITKRTPNTSTKSLNEKSWSKVLSALQKQYNTLHGIVSTAQPSFAPGKITLTFGFTFHQKRANDPKNKGLLLDVVQSTTGQSMELECLYSKNAAATVPTAAESTTPTPAPVPPTASAPPQAITQVFGGGEVL